MTAEQQLKEQTFHSSRHPFYINQNGEMVFPRRKIDFTASHVDWFAAENIPFLGTIRGFIKDNYAYLYINDFEIPDVSPHLLSYIFLKEPSINWIGLGCHKGNVGEEWLPKLIVLKGKENAILKPEEQNENI